MLQFNCPNCKHSIVVDDRYAAKSGRCNHCNSKIQVPTAEYVSSREGEQLDGGSARLYLLATGVFLLGIVSISLVAIAFNSFSERAESNDAILGELNEETYFDSHDLVEMERDYDVPQSVISEITNEVERRYKDSTSLQESIIRNEMGAYQNIQAMKAGAIPQDIFEEIKREVQTRHARNYSIQESIIRNEMGAYDGTKVSNVRTDPVDVAMDKGVASSTQKELDIAWGMTPSEIKKIVEFELIDESAADILYQGYFGVHPAIVGYIFNRNRLSGVYYSLTRTYSYDMEPVVHFTQIRKQLNADFSDQGNLHSVWHNEASPWRDDIENHAQAILAGHLELRCVWVAEQSTVLMSLSNSNGNVRVRINYESNEFSERLGLPR